MVKRSAVKRRVRSKSVVRKSVRRSKSKSRTPKRKGTKRKRSSKRKTTKRKSSKRRKLRGGSGVGYSLSLSNKVGGKSVIDRIENCKAPMGSNFCNL